MEVLFLVFVLLFSTIELYAIVLMRERERAIERERERERERDGLLYLCLTVVSYLLVVCCDFS